MITVTTYAYVPEIVQGLVRDLRVCWALEEAGLSYEIKLLQHQDRLSAEHLAQQPFAQVPVYEEDGLSLFESGAILLHVAEKSETLLPADPAAAKRATVWLMAALNSVEGPIQQLAGLDFFHAGEDWAAAQRPMVEAAVRTRLDQLAAHLGKRHWLEGDFTVGDLMMATVLRVLRHTDLVTNHPVLGPYLARAEARPAFRKALADHMAVYMKNAPVG